MRGEEEEEDEHEEFVKSSVAERCVPSSQELAITLATWEVHRKMCVLPLPSWHHHCQGSSVAKILRNLGQLFTL